MSSDIELVDCNPLCIEEMEKIVLEGKKMGVHKSWDEKKRRTCVLTYCIERLISHSRFLFIKILYTSGASGNTSVFSKRAIYFTETLNLFSAKQVEHFSVTK